MSNNSQAISAGLLSVRFFKYISVWIHCNQFHRPYLLLTEPLRKSWKRLRLSHPTLQTQRVLHDSFAHHRSVVGALLMGISSHPVIRPMMAFNNSTISFPAHSHAHTSLAAILFNRVFRAFGITQQARRHNCDAPKPQAGRQTKPMTPFFVDGNGRPAHRGCTRLFGDTLILSITPHRTPYWSASAASREFITPAATICA